MRIPRPSAAAFAACCFFPLAAAGLRAGDEAKPPTDPQAIGPEPTALKPPPDLARDAAYDSVMRLAFQPFRSGLQFCTPTWRGKQRFRSMKKPSASGRADAEATLSIVPTRDPPLKLSFPGKTVRCDVNGDGKYVGRGEVFSENAGDASYGPLVVNAQWPPPDGTDGKYALFMWKQFSDGSVALDSNFKPEGTASHTHFAIARGGAMQGRLNDGVSTVALIDDNTNGRYDDWGLDALVIDGRPQPLGPLVCLRKGGLQYVKAAPSGAILLLGPYAGPVGQLAAQKGFSAPAGLRFAFLLVAGEAGVFELAGFGADKAPVPPGRYSFHEGQLAGAGGTVRVQAGALAPVEVPAGDQAQGAGFGEWGAPLKLHAQVSGGLLGVEVKGICITGKGGETYWPQSQNTPVVVFSERGAVLKQEPVPWQADGTWGHVSFDPSREATIDVTIVYGNTPLGALSSESYQVQRGKP